MVGATRFEPVTPTVSRQWPRVCFTNTTKIIKKFNYHANNDAIPQLIKGVYSYFLQSNINQLTLNIFLEKDTNYKICRVTIKKQGEILCLKNLAVVVNI